MSLYLKSNFLIPKCIKFLCISTKPKKKSKYLRLKLAAYWLFLSRLWTGLSFRKQLQRQPWIKSKLDLNGNKQSFYDKRANMKYWLSFKFDLKAFVTPFSVKVQILQYRIQLSFYIALISYSFLTFSNWSEVLEYL